MLPRNKALAISFFLCLTFMPVNLYAREPNVVIQFYQDHISTIDGDRCQMHPSCSQYAAKAFARHGFFIGWIMISDRLIRCGRDEITISPKIKAQGQIFTCDPVSANDFWWFEKKHD